MIEFELKDGDALAAQTLLADVTVDAALVARVAEAVRVHREEQEALRATSRDYDPSVGRRTRWFVSVIFGVVWTVVPLVLWYVGSFGVLTGSHLGHILTNILLCVFGGGLFYWARDSMTRTAINRGIVGVMTAAFIAQILVSIGAWIADLPSSLVLVLYFAVWTGVAGAAVATIEARLWPSVVAFGACFLAGMSAPEYRHLLASFGNAVLAINTTFLWSRPEEDLGEVRRRFRAPSPERGVAGPRRAPAPGVAPLLQPVGRAEDRREPACRLPERERVANEHRERHREQRADGSPQPTPEQHRREDHERGESERFAHHARLDRVADHDVRREASDGRRDRGPGPEREERDHHRRDRRERGTD
ncbi:hypothetical protein DAPPUDRAFT_277920, partial [Daphnia pulex]